RKQDAPVRLETRQVRRRRQLEKLCAPLSYSKLEGDTTMRFNMLSRLGSNAVRSARRRVLTLAIGLGMLVAAASLTAQQPPEVKAGPEHALLKEWEGTWDAAVKSMAGDSKGTVTWKVDLNGLWLLEHFKADFGGMPFEGLGATSYDAA